MFNTAFKLHSQGKLDEAEKIYREILDKEPENAQVYNLLGLIKLTKKELDIAEKFILKALSIKKDAYFYENLARVYEYKQDYETEIKVLEKACEEVHCGFEIYFILLSLYSLMIFSDLSVDPSFIKIISISFNV